MHDPTTSRTGEVERGLREAAVVRALRLEEAALDCHADDPLHLELDDGLLVDVARLTSHLVPGDQRLVLRLAHRPVDLRVEVVPPQPSVCRIRALLSHPLGGDHRCGLAALSH